MTNLEKFMNIDPDTVEGQSILPHEYIKDNEEWDSVKNCDYEDYKEEKPKKFYLFGIFSI